MAQMKLNAMIAATPITKKTDFKTKALVLDDNGNQVFNRKIMAVDLDSDQAAIIKVSFSADQQDHIQKSVHKTGIMTCDVRFYNGNAYFDLIEFKPAA